MNQCVRYLSVFALLQFAIWQPVCAQAPAERGVVTDQISGQPNVPRNDVGTPRQEQQAGDSTIDLVSHVASSAVACATGEPNDCGPGLDFTQYALQGQECEGMCERLPFRKLYAQTDLVFLSRADEPYSLGFSSLGGTVAPISLKHGLAPGLRATIGMRTGSTGQLQLSYLGINEWSADNRTNAIPFGAAPGRLSSVDSYSANLNDLQLNLIAMDPYSDWDWLVGLRVVDQRDELGSLLTLDDGLGNPNSVVTESVAAEAANTLLGLQIGTRYRKRFGPISIGGGVKAGAFNNFISQSGTLYAGSVSIDGVQEPTFDTEDQDISFMGDFMADFAYHCTPGVSLRLGYQGLIFGKTAQSSQQAGVPSSPRTLDYHGAFAGFEWRK